MALFAPDPMRLTPRAAEPAPDRAPETLASGTPAAMRGELESLLGADRVKARAIDLIAYASDASPYRLFPQAVVMAHDAEDVAKAMSYGARSGVPVTFRAGGTSLNGQSQGDGSCRRPAPLRGREGRGRRPASRVRPGTVLGRANAFLVRQGFKLGPDPGQHRRRNGRRRDREQLGRDAVRHLARLLQHGALDDARPAVGNRDRHGRPRRGGAFRRR